MPSLSSLSDHRAYHILSYGTLLGTSFFHSFVGGVIAYQTLPRPQFSRLMEKTFPYFFALQTALPLAMMVTYPGELLAQFGGEQAHTNAGLTGLLAESNRWTVLAPLATILGTSLLNMLVLGPATTRTMKTRHHQETRDGKKSYDAGPHSPEMEQLNKHFAQLHGISSILNLAGYAATVFYGFVLAERL